MFNGVIGYYSGRILESLNADNNEDQKIFISSIYSEVTNIIGRVDSGGTIHGIEINAPTLPTGKPLLFDETKKEYLASLKDQYFLGEAQELVGEVFKLYPNSGIVAIRKSKRGKCTVFLQPQHFDQIRYAKPDQTKVKFTGRPRYPLGVETRAISEFEAYEVEFV